MIDNRMMVNVILLIFILIVTRYVKTGALNVIVILGNNV